MEGARQNYETSIVDDDALSTDESNALFGPDSSENMPVKEERLIRKAKRTLRISTSEDGPGTSTIDNGQAISNSPTSTGHHGSKSPLAFTKNSRKSRNPYSRGRGQPKKGGAGGKGVWGRPGSELEETGVCRDTHDPNYDSDNQEGYKLEKVDAVLTEEQLEKSVKPILQEYLEHGNTCEVDALLNELNIGRSNRYKIAKMAVLLAMDRHNPHRELISRLISDLYSSVLSQDDIALAFNELLNGVDDLLLDTPDAHNLLGQFIARCIADDCLPPKFITAYKGKVDNGNIKSALEKADILLSMNHGIAHLDNIWGMGGGNRPVKYLTNKIIALLKEYLNAGDVNEAMRCLQELEVPHFHHELVYQACDLVIEDSTERVRDMMVQLLKLLTSTNVITLDQFEKGVKRIINDIHDINLDVPAAYVLLEQLAAKLHSEGVLGDTLFKELPSRGRKRFVSEGDGGLLKPSAF